MSDRDDHADQPGGERQHEAPPLAQVAEVELAPRLQPDDEEEQGHQPLLTQVRRSCVIPTVPSRMESSVLQTDS